MTERHENWFIFQAEHLLLIKSENHYQLPAAVTLTLLKANLLRQHYLGHLNNVDCYCAEIDNTATLPPDVEPVLLRKAFEILGEDWYAATAKAYSVINWDKTHQFCSRCGHATVHRLGTFERVCSVCHFSLYPRISPSIIVRISKEDQILMARSPHFTPGAYGLIAGFVEVGESAEDAVHREVKEEVTIEIKNLRYFGSQSWPFPDSLMLGFTADYARGEINIDTNEIEAAGWYRYDKLPGRPSSHMSIASRLIDDFIAKWDNTRSGY